MISKKELLELMEKMEEYLFETYCTAKNFLLDQGFSMERACRIAKADMAASAEAIKIISCWLEKYKPERKEIPVSEASTYINLVITDCKIKHVKSLLTFEEISKLHSAFSNTRETYFREFLRDKKYYDKEKLDE